MGLYIFGPNHEMIADQPLDCEESPGAIVRARGGGGRLPTRANMHLISAAPELFRYLKEARIALRQDINVSLCADIDRTIAKAEGRYND